MNLSWKYLNNSILQEYLCNSISGLRKLIIFNFFVVSYLPKYLNNSAIDSNHHLRPHSIILPGNKFRHLDSCHGLSERYQRFRGIVMSCTVMYDIYAPLLRHILCIILQIAILSQFSSAPKNWSDPINIQIDQKVFNISLLLHLN